MRSGKQGYFIENGEETKITQLERNSKKGVKEGVKRTSRRLCTEKFEESQDKGDKWKEHCSSE